MVHIDSRDIMFFKGGWKSNWNLFYKLWNCAAVETFGLHFRVETLKTTLATSAWTSLEDVYTVGPVIIEFL